MISKLVAWAEDRPIAIARMRRALDEYLVTGIKTTVPFFRWLLGQPAFADGRFHTAYLDEVLKSRGGRPFVEPTPRDEDLAAIAAALDATLSASDAAHAASSSNANGGAPSGWRAQARIEGVGGSMRPR